MTIHLSREELLSHKGMSVRTRLREDRKRRGLELPAADTPASMQRWDWKGSWWTSAVRRQVLRRNGDSITMALELKPGRMTSFSDGVIAVIITIMVLELKVPAHDVPDLAGLRSVVPMLVIYALSFVEVGIYWVNHHYLVDDVDQVSHSLLWSNLAFLFTLSLIPFGTAWVGERGLSPFALSLYSVCCVLPAVSWMVLSMLVRRRSRAPIPESRQKQAISSALYVGVIPVSYYSLTGALLMLFTVAVLWLIPPKHVREITRAKSADR
jgi:uncharacterized membrane protein